MVIAWYSIYTISLYHGTARVFCKCQQFPKYIIMFWINYCLGNYYWYVNFL